MIKKDNTDWIMEVIGFILHMVRWQNYEMSTGKNCFVHICIAILTFWKNYKSLFYLYHKNGETVWFMTAREDVLIDTSVLT